MRTVLSLLLLVMVSAAAQAQQVQRIEIWDAGIYSAEETGTAAAPGVAAGYTNVLSNIKLIRKTATVPATLGTHFGFRYRVVGEPNGAAVSLKMVDHYPSPGLRNPATGNTLMRAEHSVKRKLGSESYTDYGFDDNWELLPGTWTFEIWQDNRKLVEQRFTVVKP